MYVQRVNKDHPTKFYLYDNNPSRKPMVKRLVDFAEGRKATVLDNNKNIVFMFRTPEDANDFENIFKYNLDHDETEEFGNRAEFIGEYESDDIFNDKYDDCEFDESDFESIDYNDMSLSETRKQLLLAAYNYFSDMMEEDSTEVGILEDRIEKVQEAISLLEEADVETSASEADEAELDDKLSCLEEKISDYEDNLYSIENIFSKNGLDIEHYLDC